MSKLVTLTKAQVPSYLTESEFYKNLSADDDDEFCIPQEYYKSTLRIANAEELTHLFHTMKFWGLNKLPHKVIELLVFDPKAVFSDKRESVSKVLLEFDKEFGIHTLYKSLSECTCEEESLGVAINCGREDVLEYLYLFHPMSDPFTLALLKAVAENGYINLLERIACIVLLSIKNPFKGVSVTTVCVKITKRTYQSAVIGGNVECLKFLRSRGAVTWDISCTRAAAKHGHLSCLQYLLDGGCKVDRTTTEAAADSGHDRCLMLLLEKKCAVGPESVCRAAEHGHVECLRILKTFNVSFDDSDKVHMQMWRFSGNHGMVFNGCPCCEDACLAAAQCGHLPALQLLRSYHCLWDERVSKEAARLCRNMLVYCVENGCPIDAATIARYNTLQAMQAVDL
eukprot:gene13859-15936_t